MLCYVQELWLIIDNLNMAMEIFNQNFCHRLSRCLEWYDLFCRGDPFGPNWPCVESGLRLYRYFSEIHFSHVRFWYFFGPKDSLSDIAGGEFHKHLTWFSCDCLADSVWYRNIYWLDWRINFDGCANRYDGCICVVRFCSFRNTWHSKAIAPLMLFELIKYVVLFSNCFFQHFYLLVLGS